mgnify:CR=1 FL=1
MNEKQIKILIPIFLVLIAIVTLLGMIIGKSQNKDLQKVLEEMHEISVIEDRRIYGEDEAFPIYISTSSDFTATVDNGEISLEENGQYQSMIETNGDQVLYFTFKDDSKKTATLQLENKWSKKEYRISIQEGKYNFQEIK